MSLTVTSFKLLLLIPDFAPKPKREILKKQNNNNNNKKLTPFKHAGMKGVLSNLHAGSLS